MIILTGTKLNSQFNIRYDTNKQHKHDLVYLSSCSSTTCIDSYRHCLNTYHETVNTEHFKILNMGYNNNIYRRRISEALFVKQYRLSLIVLDNSVPLELFN